MSAGPAVSAGGGAGGGGGGAGGSVPVPPAVVTAMSAGPAVSAGVVAVIEVALTTVMLSAATPSKVTPVAPVKFVPLIVTAVPPVVGPLPGLKDVTVGAVV